MPSDRPAEKLFATLRVLLVIVLAVARLTMRFLHWLFWFSLGFLIAYRACRRLNG